MSFKGFISPLTFWYYDKDMSLTDRALSWNCNVAIGKLDDNPDTVLNAYKYLKGELK